MEFENDLYRAMCDAYPAITVRSFSVAMGRSSGYWSSITAQELPVSNAALIHLNDFIECKKLLSECDEFQLKKLNTIQRSIAREIVERFSIENESFEEVWEEVSTALRIESAKDAELYSAMPFAYSIY